MSCCIRWSFSKMLICHISSFIGVYSVGPLQPLHKCLLMTDSFGGTAHYSPVMMQEGTLQMSTARCDDSVRHSELISSNHPHSRGKNTPDEGTIQLWGPAEWSWLIWVESVSSRRVTFLLFAVFTPSNLWAFHWKSSQSSWFSASGSCSGTQDKFCCLTRDPWSPELDSLTWTYTREGLASILRLPIRAGSDSAAGFNWLINPRACG